MIGVAPTIKDVNLYPVNNVDLSCDEVSLEVEQYPYKIVGHCVGCNQGIKLYVCTTRDGILKLQQQLADELGILCADCGRHSFQHGRQKRR